MTNDSAKIGSQGQSGQPARKRRRVAQACAPCRRRKSRCNGAHPTCSACAELNHACSYVDPEGSQPLSMSKDVLQGLEHRLASLEAKISTNGHHFHLDHCRNWKSNLQQSPAETQVQISGQDARGSVNNSGPLMVSSRDPTDGMGHYIFADEEGLGYFGPSSNIYFTRDISEALLHVMRTHEAHDTQCTGIKNLGKGVLVVSRPGSPTSKSNAKKNDDTGTLGDPKSTNPHFLPIELKTRYLIDRYFADTGLLFPYLHRETFLQVYAELLQNVRLVRRTWLALLNMVLAMAVFTSMEDGTDASERQKESHLFYARAMKLCGQSISAHASLETVQYLLLVSQYLQGTSTSSQTWAMHGLAVKAALQLGLQSTEALKRYEPLEQEIRKRTWFGCVVLDRTLSMTFGRPPTIPECFLKLQLPVSFDEVLQHVQTPASQHSTNFYSATITLYNILGNVMQLLYGDNLGCDQMERSSEILPKILRLEERLDDWEKGTAEPLRPTNSWATTDDVSHRLRVILTLRYLNLKLLIHRPIISSMLREMDGTDPNTTNLLSIEQARKVSLETCVKSSMEIITIVHNATVSTGPRRGVLGAWWFSLYYTVNAALTLFAASLIYRSYPYTGLSTYAPQDNLRGSIQQAVEALRNLDKSNQTVERCGDCIRRLDQVIAQLTITPFDSEVEANGQTDWVFPSSSTPSQPPLWAGHDTDAVSGQSSFLDFIGRFDNNFPFLMDFQAS